MITSIVKNDQFNKFADLAGFVLIICWAYFVIFQRYHWVAANQAAFHLPLVVLWWVIVFPSFRPITLGLISWISYFISDYDVIDDLLHYSLQNAGLFPSFISDPSGFVNPQYTKLVLYAISIVIVGIMILFKKNRTTLRSFAFLSGLGCMLVTLIIHQSIPFTTLKWERDMVINNVSSIIKVIKENPSIDPKMICHNFNLICYQDLTKDEMLKKFNHPQMDTLTNEHSLTDNLVFEHSRFNDDSFVRQVFGIIKKGNNNYSVFIEEDLINKSQVVSENAFGKLNLIANLIWGQGLLLLGLFHTSERRKTLFSKNR